MRRVVITGMGMLHCAGLNLKEAWENAVEGKSGIRKIQSFDASNYSVQIAGEVQGFDPTTVTNPKDAQKMTRFMLLALGATKDAVSDANLSLTGNTDRIGCSLGSGMGGLEEVVSNAVALHEKGPKRVSPFCIPYSITNMAAGVVANQFNLKGPNICTTTACTSSTHAIGEALLYIRNDMADVMIAGGSESTILGLGVAGFANMKALSRNNDNPSGASRPFDKDRDGFVMGEGASILVLEELEHAKARGAKIYAEVIGYGMSGDAYHITQPSPGGEGAQRCMAAALRSAKISPDQVDYINAHGTSTHYNDITESMAIAKVFGPAADKIWISSTKGVTGHCLGGAGAIEAAYLAKAIETSIVPPTANLENVDPECPLDYVPKVARQRTIRYGISNSFGFGGTNGTLVLGKI